MAALSTLTTTSTPEARDSSLACARIRKQGATVNQLLVLGVIGENVRLDVRDQSNTLPAVLTDEAFRVRESVTIPSEDIPRLRFRLRHCIAGAHLETRAGNIVLLQLGSELHQSITCPRLIQHRVLHPASQIPVSPSRHEHRKPDQLCVKCDNFLK